MIEILHPTRDRRRIAQVCADGYRCVDAWPDVLVELGAIDRPDAEPAERARYIARCWPERAVVAASRYAVYPWRRTIVRLPERDLFHRLCTARNRWLLSEPEQAAWARAQIAIAGLSVGSSVLTVCALTGARRLRVADPDTLGLTNLNRLAGSVCDLGTAKLDLATRRVLELDPYASVEGFPGGYTPATADRFLDGLTVLVEEMDDLAMKLHIRIRAKAARIPVVMVTDNGDDVILDVERFDLDPDYPVLHGRVGTDELSSGAFGDLTDPARRVRLAGAIVGEVSPRMQYSLGQVGRTLPTWPQLGTAATLSGAVGAYAARLIACGDDLPSGRHFVPVRGYGVRPGLRDHSRLAKSRRRQPGICTDPNDEPPPSWEPDAEPDPRTNAQVTP